MSMSDARVRELMDGLDDGETFALDVDSVVRRGRTAVRMRRGITGAAACLAAAVVAVGTVATLPGGERSVPAMPEDRSAAAERLTVALNHAINLPPDMRVQRLQGQPRLDVPPLTVTPGEYGKSSPYLSAEARLTDNEGSGRIEIIFKPDTYGPYRLYGTCEWDKQPCEVRRTANGDVVKVMPRADHLAVYVRKEDGTDIAIYSYNTPGRTASPDRDEPPLSTEKLEQVALDPDLTLFP